MRTAFFVRLRRGRTASTCRCASPEIDERLKNGPELVSANFVIPYPPGFPIMVPGQVITAETIDFMRKLDVKEIHGYEAARGPEAAQARRARQASQEARPTPDRSAQQGGMSCKLLSVSSAANPFILLFLTVGLAVWLGRQSIGGYGLGMVAAAIIVGCGLSVWASAYGVKLRAQQLHQVACSTTCSCTASACASGPSFVNSLGGDGLKFTLLAVVCSRRRPGPRRRWARKLFDLPPGAAGGILAGSQTMSAAIGSAEEAVTAGRRHAAGGHDAGAGQRDDRARPTASPTSGARSASS